MAWSLDSDRPIYMQIIEIIQMQIVSGHYHPGDKLPSVRELAAEANVNPNTMQKAFSELERNGLIITKRTSGRIVTEDIEMIKDIRLQLAKESILEFLKKLRELGYQTEETISLIETIAKEENT